jgi:hypothetical protein
MNLDEATEVLKAVSAIPVKDINKAQIKILFTQGEGYALHIKKKSVNAKFRDHLNKIVESSKLHIHEVEDYLIIHSHL